MKEKRVSSHITDREESCDVPRHGEVVSEQHLIGGQISDTSRRKNLKTLTRLDIAVLNNTSNASSCALRSIECTPSSVRVNLSIFPLSWRP